MKLASFDIFDTTLVRKCGKPENIFYILSRRAYPDNEALQNSLFLWRKDAEQQARSNQDKEEVDLKDIYTQFDPLSFPQWTARELMDMEIKVEMDDLVANAQVKQLISKKREAGYTICFISDMYLPSDVLKKKLLDAGCARAEDPVFVSCEMGVAKRNGTLYDAVRAHMGRIDRWEHYGDNARSDYRKALKKGIKATLIHTDYTAAEELLQSTYRRTPFFHEISILAGLQRAARLTAETRNADVDNAADFVSSLYVPYVIYILDKARELGLKRLYFLSRDGYILQKIAEVFQPDYPDIELRYLFVSRYSLFLPSLYTLSKEELYENKGLVSFRQHRTSVKDILHYLRTSPDELGETFREQITFKQIRTKEQEDLFMQMLQRPEVRNSLLERAARERELLTAYFRQEKMLDGEAWGTVDVGWLGTSRLMINRILEKEGLSKQPGFYCGCQNDMLPPRYGECYCFYKEQLFSPQIPGLLEQYYSASPYSSTERYYQEGAEILPLFKAEKFKQNADIVQANVETARQIAAWLRNYHLPWGPAMQVWGSSYLQMFLHLSCPVDYSTFSRLGKFEDVTSQDTVIRRIGPFRLLTYLYKGKIKHVIFPRQSICYTYKIKVCTPENCYRERRRRFFKKIKTRLLSTFYSLCTR